MIHSTIKLSYLYLLLCDIKGDVDDMELLGWNEVD